MSTDFERGRQAFLDGVAHLEGGRWSEAQACLLESLARVPGRPSTLQNLGLARLRLGLPEQALQALGPVLQAEPDATDAWAHHAEALLALGRDEEALDSLDRALALDPARDGLRLQQGLALSRLDRPADALACYEAVCARRPADAAAWLYRGQALQALERHDEALPCFQRATAIDPDLAEAWSQQGAILKDRQQLDEAARCFRAALAAGGDAELNAYLLASVTGEAPPAHAPEPYVRFLFDSYASGFDEHLLKVLHYQAPTVLRDALVAEGFDRFGSVLDLGCGTGLCGTLLRPRCDRLVGVDVAPLMLERARARAIYDALLESDLTEHLRNSPDRHDLVVSADVFIYVGALEAVFAGVARVLNPGGVFAFSVEVTDDAHDFRLLPSSRYAHSRRYLLALAAGHGLAVRRMAEHPLREDQRRPVNGLYALLQKA